MNTVAFATLPTVSAVAMTAKAKNFLMISPSAVQNGLYLAFSADPPRMARELWACCQALAGRRLTLNGGVTCRSTRLAAAGPTLAPIAARSAASQRCRSGCGTTTPNDPTERSQSRPAHLPPEVLMILNNLLRTHS
jgi:hypothetical protein